MTRLYAKNALRNQAEIVQEKIALSDRLAKSENQTTNAQMYFMSECDLMKEVVKELREMATNL